VTLELTLTLQIFPITALAVFANIYYLPFQSIKLPAMVLFDSLTPKNEVIIRSPWVRPWNRNNSGKYGPIEIQK